MVQYFDAQSQNNNGRSARKYSDLDLFFGKKSSNSDVSDVVISLERNHLTLM